MIISQRSTNIIAQIIYNIPIGINRNDFRAWYGLGQAYEILKMPYYSLFYYKQAQALR